MIKTSDSIVAISKALLTFQGQVDGVGKTKSNPAFKGSRYATLENVRDTAVPELQKVGVFFMQSAGAIVDGVMSMTTRLTHAESGEWMEGTMDIPLGKRDPQGMGSAQSYAQRYQLMAMLGLPAVDDDAEDAIDRNNQRQMPQKPAAQPVQAPKPKTVAELKAAYEKLKGELATEQVKGWRNLQNWLKDPSVLSDIDALERFAPNFKAEARAIFDLTKSAEQQLGEPAKVTGNYVPPDFSDMQDDIPYADRDELQEALNMNGENK